MGGETSILKSRRELFNLLHIEGIPTTDTFKQQIKEKTHHHHKNNRTIYSESNMIIKVVSVDARWISVF